MTARDWLTFVRNAAMTVSRSRFGLRLRYREWDALPASLREYAHRNERAILDVLRLETQPAPAAPSEARPAPPRTTPTFHGVAITEKDVCECLAAVGGDALARYERGHLPKTEAYAMTREWLAILASMSLRHSRDEAPIGPTLSRGSWPF